MNRSKINEPRFWMKWRKSGAVGTTNQSTFIDENQLRNKCRKEGVDFSKVCVLRSRWAESASRRKGVQSALVRCDLIVRSDGSIVLLDGGMGIDSLSIAQDHIAGAYKLSKLPWDDYVTGITQLPS